jgi:hypothetical protein
MGTMKTTLPKIVLLTCILFAGAGYAAFAGRPASGITRDSIFVYKQEISRSNKILLYPDATQKVLFFSVKGEEGRAYQMFIFDLEGRLVRQTEIRNKQTTVIKEIDKGVYLFNVFSDDKKIGDGQLTVR